MFKQQRLPYFPLFFTGLCALLLAGTYNQMKKNPTVKPTITIGIAGDTMLGRLVNETIAHINTTKQGQGFIYPWGNVLPYLKKNDLNLVNLETTLTTSEKKVAKVFNFKADPAVVKTLIAGNITVVNLANNHSLDFGPEGLTQTISTLDAAGIAHIGAGANTTLARKPVIIEKNGIKIGFIGLTDNEPSWKATRTKAGTNYIHVGNIEHVRKDIAQVRDSVDLLIASIHWGPNKREVPTQEFIDFAHQMIESGVDILHGHSAHVVQGIEVYKNKLILYDTGDFVDDYIVGPVLRNDHTFLFQVAVIKDGIEKLTLIPLLIKMMQVNRAPDDDKSTMVKRIKKLSLPFGTQMEEKNGRLEVWVKGKPI